METTSMASSSNRKVVDNYITISINSKSKVISLKVDEITLYFFDRLASKLGVSRSFLLRKIMRILSRVADKVEYGRFNKLEINISVFNDNGDSYSVSASLIGDDIYIEK